MQKIEKQLLFRIITRFDLLLFSYIIALAIVYITGNYKFYLSNSLFTLLKSISFLSIILLFFSLFSIGYCVFIAVKTKNKPIMIYLVPFCLLLIFSIIVFLLTISVSFISEGM